MRLYEYRALRAIRTRSSEPCSSASLDHPKTTVKTTVEVVVAVVVGFSTGKETAPIETAKEPGEGNLPAVWGGRGYWGKWGETGSGGDHDLGLRLVRQRQFSTVSSVYQFDSVDQGAECVRSEC